MTQTRKSADPKPVSTHPAKAAPRLVSAPKTGGNVIPFAPQEPPEELEALAREKLARSTISLDHALSVARMELLSRAETQSLVRGFRALRAIKIPYFDEHGEPQLAHPGAEQFFRVRYLDEPVPKDDKFHKYDQPRGAGNLGAYLPQGRIDWPAVFADASEPIIITEGELKAIATALASWNAIGLGGVHSFQAKSNGIDLLPILTRINWVRRRVYIIFDSDVRSNSNVCHALTTLADLLADRGAIVKTVILTDSGDGKKRGLDDILYDCDDLDMFEKMIIGGSVFLSYGNVLWGLNERYAYVEDIGRVIKRSSGVLQSVEHFRVACTDKYQKAIVKPDNGTIYQQVPAAPEWLAWPMRQTVRTLAYAPGQAPRSLIPSRAPGARPEDLDYNLWTGWAIDPKAGDVAPFLKLIDHLFTGAPPESKIWFLRWLACPLQRPGLKMATCALIHGRYEGTGKTLIGVSMSKIYGDNYKLIRQEDLDSPFNSWAAKRQFILGDEVMGSDKRSHEDKIKNMITQATVSINDKNEKVVDFPDTINYLFASNRFNAFHIPDTDRRFFVHEVVVKPLPDQFYTDYIEWLDNGGAAALFRWLLDLDLADFNPAAKAPMTAAKAAMIASSASSLEQWVKDLKDSPDGLLVVGGVELKIDLLTGTQLCAIYDSQMKIDRPTTATAMGNALRAAGFEKVLKSDEHPKGAQIRMGNGAAERYWIVRNEEKWLKTTLAKVKAHLEKAD